MAAIFHKRPGLATISLKVDQEKSVKNRKLLKKFPQQSFS
jgi:hypothetical protein